MYDGKQNDNKGSGGTADLKSRSAKKGDQAATNNDKKYGKNDPNKKQIRELAEKVKAKRELDLGYNHYNIPNRLNGKEDFLIFYKGEL